MNLDVVIVANHHRKAFILDYLENIPHKVSYTIDYTLPENFEPEIPGLVQPNCHTGAYRCFKGHQDAIKMCGKENVLILEDDAVPNVGDWYNIVQDSISLLDNFEIVSLHGRGFDRKLYTNFTEIRPNNNFIYILKKEESVWVCATLAYLINKRSFDKMLSYNYIGKPLDILLYNEFSFCLLEHSPFDHNRSQGSLVDTYTE